MTSTLMFPDLGAFDDDAGLRPLPSTADGRFRAGADGVTTIAATGDGKVEFVAFAHHTLAHVRSALGYPAYYPVHPVAVARPIRAVLMDLDGTSVHSEAFWVWIIERTVGELIGDPRFALEEADLPHVSGHSVSEHLQYGIRKYAPGCTVEAARAIYFEFTRREMAAILEGQGRADAFTPAPGLREFLLALKAREIKVALVTSGLYEKAYPEIVAAFRVMGLGDPATFYDAIITAGTIVGQGGPGTLGELPPKPHPWLYAEAARIGLGIPFEERATVVGIEDSGAGVCAVRLAGFAPIGVSGGNIEASDARALCHAYCNDLDSVLAYLLTT